MTTFTVEAIKAAIEETVAGHEDYHYKFPVPQTAIEQEIRDMNPRMCFYASTDDSGEYAPSCIVGHVIAKLDPDLFKQIADYERTKIVTDSDDYWNPNGWALPDTGIDDIVQQFNIKTDDASVVWALSRAQYAQDGGDSWGVALSRFHAALGHD